MYQTTQQIFFLIVHFLYLVSRSISNVQKVLKWKNIISSFRALTMTGELSKSLDLLLCDGFQMAFDLQIPDS